MTAPSDLHLRRLGELHRETWTEWQVRFCRDRGIAFTDADLAEMVAWDAENYPNIVERERREARNV